MNSKFLLYFLASLFSITTCAGTKEDLDAIIFPQMKQGDLEKVIVGVTENGQRSYFTYGAAVDENSIFEIGSITKTFTGLSLGILAAKGKVQFDDPLSKYIPALANTDAGKITLIQLSTHTSGLERIPSNLMAADQHCQGPDHFDAANPYAEYSVKNLICYLKNQKIVSKPTYFSGAQYSNTGIEVLALALAYADGLDSFSELVKKNVLIPLSLKNITIDLNRAQIRHSIQGRNVKFDPTPAWTWDQHLGGAGSLRANAQDLLTYIEAQINPPKSIAPAIHLNRQVQRMGTKKWDIGLNWLIQKDKTDPIIWHNGETGGFSSYAYFQVGSKKGAVMLSNTGNPVQCLEEYFTGLACKIDFGFPLSESELARTLGVYQLEGGKMKLQIFRKAQALFVSANGVMRLRPSSATHFTFTAIDASLDLNIDSHGFVQSLILNQNGQKARFFKQ